MKKNLSLLCLTVVLLVHSLLYAQPGNNKQLSKTNYKKPEILFEQGSWTNALEKAKATHKYIFVDAYASWCGPCKMLKATTFKNKEAAAFFNKNFINFSIDMGKGEGPNLAEQWQVQGYPTLIILDTAGKAVLGSVGFLKPEELIKFGKQALEKNSE